MLIFHNPMHERLVNWAAWVRDRKGRGHCGSIEYRYIPERLADAEIRRQEQTREVIDRIDALLIEKCVCATTFPQKHRKVLVEYYVYRSMHQVIARKVKIRYRDVEEEIKNACNIVRNRVEHC